MLMVLLLSLGITLVPTASAECSSDVVVVTLGCDPESQDTDCAGYAASVFVNGEWMVGLSYQDPMTNGSCDGGRTYCVGAAGQGLVYYDPYNTRAGLC